MKMLKRTAALAALLLMLAAFIAPGFYADTITYTFSEVYILGHRFYYPDDGPKPTVTISGSKITFTIPDLRYTGEYIDSNGQESSLPSVIYGTMDDEINKVMEENPTGWLRGRGIGLSRYGTVDDDFTYIESDVEFNTADSVDEVVIRFLFRSETDLYQATIEYYVEVLSPDLQNHRTVLGKRIISFDKPYGSPQIVTSNAEQDSGEDKGAVFEGSDPVDDRDTGGTDVARTVSAAAGGAAVAVGVGAAVSKGKKKNNKKEKKKRVDYKMYVFKDFGDSIRKGAQPVRVCARIARIEDGREFDDPQLTAAIIPSTRRLNLDSYGMYGRYMAANVSVGSEISGDSGTVTFTLRTAAGTFTRNIIFRLLGEPYIHFVEKNSDESLTPLGNRESFEAILGDGFEYTKLFMLREAAEEPDRFDTESEKSSFEIRVEKTNRQYLYRAVFKNRTASPDRNEVFSKIRKEVQYITAKFKDGSSAGCYAVASLFPEGLSVRAEKIENERIPIKCYGMENDKNTSDRFAGEKFCLTLAVKTDKGAELFHLPDSKVKLTFAKNLEGDTRQKDPVSDKIAGKYGFKIEPEGRGEFRFIPQDWLFQPKKDTVYGAVLTAACNYQGTRYERNIPLRLIGQLDDPMGGWQKEYDGLKKRIEKFSLPEEKDKWIARFEQCSTNPPCSVEELRLVSKEILFRYMDYWEKQNEKDKAYALKMDRMLSAAEWTKFVGDCAFSYLVKLYAGPLADAVITPCKDIFLYSVGEYLASCGRGESFDVRNLEIYKSLNTAGDLVSSIWMAQGVKSNLTDFKKIFYYIAGYFVLAIFRNYFKIMGEQNKSDWWGAITAAFRDLTISTFRIAAGELFRKWIEKSQLFKKMFGEKTAELITKELKGQIKTNVDFNSKGVTFSENISPETAVALAVERFLVRLVGKGAAAVYDKLAPKFANSSFGLNEQNQPVYCFPFYESDSGITVYIEINLTQIVTCMASGPFAFGVLLFQTFFNRLIGWNEPVTFQSDPPVERDRKREQRTQAELKANYDKMFNNPSS
jgi:hypothetical protein